MVLCGVTSGQAHESGLEVHRVAGGFGPMRWPGMARALRNRPGRRVLWVQYAPHSMGLRGMNAPLALWRDVARAYLSRVRCLGACVCGRERGVCVSGRERERD